MTHYVRKSMILFIALVVGFMMLAAMPSDEACAAAKNPSVAKKTTVALNGKKTLSIKKNGFTITKVVSVKSKKKTVARAYATKSRVDVYGIKAGQARITVRVKAKKGKTEKTCSLTTKVTVKKPKAKLSASSVNVGYTAKVKISDLAKGAGVTYISSDTSALPVSKGVVKARKKGSYSVKARVVLKKTKYAKKKTLTLNAGKITAKLDIDRLLKKMTLKQKISQMIIPSIPQWEGTDVTDLSEAKDLAAVLRKHQYGGIILFGQNIKDTEKTARLVGDLQVNNAKGSDADGAIIPYMMSADQEGGSVNRLSTGTRMTGSMALGATGDNAAENTRITAEILGKEMSSLGLNTDLAPCIDVIDDLTDPGWNTRVFSDDPQTVSELGLAFKAGMDKYNVITTYKHFPGAGDGSDYPTAVNIESRDLEQNGLRTYKDTIDNGAEMLMVSAVTFPEIDDRQIMADGTTEGYYPASLSEKIVGDMLRKELGFEGVIMTDALAMDQFIYEPTGFVPRSPDNIRFFNGKEHTVEHDLNIAEKAINAGCDILLIPAELIDKESADYYDGYVEGIEKMVKDGRISEERINESTKRILSLKEKRKIFDTDTKGDKMDQTVEKAKKIVGSKEHHDAERKIAGEAVTLLKNQGRAVPVSGDNSKVLIICNAEVDSNSVTYGLEQLISEGVIAENTRIDNRITGAKQGNEDAGMQIVIDKFGKDESGKLIYDSRLSEAAADADSVICLSKILPLSGPGAVRANEAMTGAVEDALVDVKAKGKKFILLSTSLPSDAAYFQDSDAIVCSYLATSYGGNISPDAGGTENAGAYNANVPAAVYAIFGGAKMTGVSPIRIPKAVKQDGKWVFTDETLYERGASAGPQSYIIAKTEAEPDWSKIPSMEIDKVLWTDDYGIRGKAQLCYSDDALFVHLSAVEKDIRAENTEPLSPVYEDSCLEFFFQLPDSPNYFNFEINPNGCLCTQFGPEKTDRIDVVRKDGTEFFDIHTDRTSDGWEVFYKIPLKYIQLYYPDYQFGGKIKGNFCKCGNKTVHRHYLSWSPIDLDSPNFHCPEYFGTLKFGE